ncbi:MULTISPECIES: helix-turn-helix domain-containing protein [Burkholderia]|uniref:Helix-turn-helix domain-containing protein n=1 Tax=Burkholderia contaminans TaxID=488447 RepID=A0A2S5DRE6_9BURK|nr:MULTISPECIES: helix-turn-helix domain-containing protein [Burkholderia]EKS9798255.1 helix-turn-helix domain-containing protein [Burkholderia cepacia]EKS9805739.1 helix-turn-helix domain-containing protein [Burkholderia cepacia]EKS9813093.1 helix-turn-helix domain-containing protein [Burkholderia cepacia]EKS9822106.1 helix-turn-helix domain-containing protein [Burkholderia cepacia]EKS9827334.1 helix-turn-helix domain-containing protein [Burkholderia cepacia]
MSLHHENLAWEIELPALKKVVLLAIARLAHLTNRECWPSVQSLAFRCGMSESAVRGAIKDLIEAGYIETMKVPGKRTVYRVLLGVEVAA